MGIITWIREKLLDGQTQLTEVDASEFWGLASSIYVRELAFRTAVNLVARAVSKCEYKTYRFGKEVKGPEWYLWNVEPNQNQSSTVFLNKLITKLMENNECLVIETNDGQMLVADTFHREPYALYGHVFSGVTVDNFTFSGTFQMKDVMFFQLNNTDVLKLVTGLHESYGTLAEYAQKAYKKSRGQKGVLNISAKAQGAQDFEEKLRKMMNDRFKPYFDADSAVLPLTEGYSYTEQQSKTYNSDSSRDIRAQIDDVFVFTGRAFGIPPALMLGDVADTSKAIDAFLTFCIDPICDMVQEEANRKRNGRDAYLAGTRMVIDTKAIKHVDLLNVASSIDKLIGSGAYSINDIRKLTGDEPIAEAWADEHFMTKNYSTMDELLAALGGGDPSA